MKSFLAFLIAAGSVVSLGDAYCFVILQVPGRPYRGCIMNGKLYPFGHIERTEDCHSCYCSKGGMQCCSLFSTSFRFDEKKCKVVFSKKSCRNDVVLREDPSKRCPNASAAG